MAFISTRSITPLKPSSRPIGIWIGTALGTKALLDRVDPAPEVGAGAVDLVDEADTRDVVAISLAPNGL